MSVTKESSNNSANTLTQSSKIEHSVSKLRESTENDLSKIRGDLDTISKSIKSLQSKLGSQTQKQSCLDSKLQ